MYNKSKKIINLFGAAVFAIVLFSFNKTKKEQISYSFPYQKAGLSKEQAAEHLLSRFTFGVRQIDIDVVTKEGLENWFEKQLIGNQNDKDVEERLLDYDAMIMSNEQILAQFPRSPILKKMAEDDGFLKKEEFKDADKKEIKKAYDAYREKKGLRPEQELFRQFINQKIIKATYSNNQLHEILTDFWFNHFNVSITKNDCAQFIPVFERDAIRPNVVNKFEDLVLTTAKSPAMLLYLDNFASMGNNKESEIAKEKLLARMQKRGKDSSINVKINKQKAKGLNENYAREVMELHTLGIDGGYTQQDVTEAARVLTGWTIYPISNYGGIGQMKKIIEKIGEDKLEKRGFVHEGDFLFAMNKHDDKAKTVLGKQYNTGGYTEGVALLKNLANHKSTATFICKKIATRFVQDVPPITLINKMSNTFLKTNGDIKKVLIEMVSAPEFWTKEALREKTKSPFEYAISSLRSLRANVTMPFQINNWITKMGQKLYFYQAPTGFPDKATYWINTGSLLNRMNFGLALASKRIPGVQFDLAALNNNHEPESADDALHTYAKIMLPQRDLANTIKRLKPLVNDPTVTDKINNAAAKTETMTPTNDMMETEMNDNTTKMEKVKKKKLEAVSLSFGDNSMLAQVVGIIIGSPEFQRK
jgi:uncharacterized protein (DUF1800 family)